MYPYSAPFIVWFGIPAIALLLAGCFVLAHRWAATSVGRAPSRAPLVGAVLWLLLWSAAAASGLPARFELRPPPFGVAVFAVVIISVWYGLSRYATPLLGLPLAWLIGVHVFRLPLELIMHEAARAGVMPVQMSYSGRNFDILTGISAPLVAWGYARGRVGDRLAACWNLLGAALLANILSVAILSTPIFAVFGPDRLNVWVAYFPFILLPAVMVAFAIAGHVIVWRALRARRASSRA